MPTQRRSLLLSLLADALGCGPIRGLHRHALSPRSPYQASFCHIQSFCLVLSRPIPSCPTSSALLLSQPHPLLVSTGTPPKQSHPALSHPKNCVDYACFCENAACIAMFCRALSGPLALPRPIPPRTVLSVPPRHPVMPSLQLNWWTRDDHSLEIPSCVYPVTSISLRE